MDVVFSREGISLPGKLLNSYDRFVLAFVRLLGDTRYVVLSGYVAILFGRSRQTEDFDIIIENIDKKRFLTLWVAITKEFECLNTRDADAAFDEYLSQGVAIRFSRPEAFIPNMEVKFVHQPLEQEALEKRILVRFDDGQVFISPLELQIAFKLFLGSEKDYEDARHLYVTCKEHLNKDILDYYVLLLRQGVAARRYLYG